MKKGVQFFPIFMERVTDIIKFVAKNPVQTQVHIYFDNLWRRVQCGEYSIHILYNLGRVCLLYTSRRIYNEVRMKILTQRVCVYKILLLTS